MFIVYVPKLYRLRGQFYSLLPPFSTAIFGVTSYFIASLYALVNEFDFCVRQQIVKIVLILSVSFSVSL